MILLTAFVFQSAVRIEVLNIQSGSYLPRRDRNLDGTLSDGKWRISAENTSRDQLREAVQTLGLLQYVLAPLLLLLALGVLLKTRRSWSGSLAAFSGVVAVSAISLMLYREHYESFGLVKQPYRG